ncbi:ABC transporter ATP-binding protein [Microbacterium sp. NPDC096154]|uniref:ABC transporter ATP-binding protein n=1 Tax=Microbacterium sp. NPDC096154 TaxID=3155549 RepID=UPI003318062B
MSSATTTSVSGDIAIDKVSKVFRADTSDPVVALDGIDLHIREGEFVSIVGASGSGKSTLLRIVDGLTAPTEGTVKIGGQQITKPGQDRGFVFQQDRLFPWRTIIDNVVLGLELRGMKRREARPRAQELLGIMGLAKFAHSYPSELSGGMRQRANLARAYAIEPQILIMDEPYAALDGQTREMMQQFLLETWDRHRRTVLFVTHQIDEAVYLSDRVVVFTSRPGRVKETIDIDLPRPRTLSVKRTPEFGRLVDRIWSSIEEEVKASMSLEMEMGR